MPVALYSPEGCPPIFPTVDSIKNDTFLVTQQRLRRYRRTAFATLSGRGDLFWLRNTPYALSLTSFHDCIASNRCIPLEQDWRFLGGFVSLRNTVTDMNTERDLSMVRGMFEQGDELVIDFIQMWRKDSLAFHTEPLVAVSSNRSSKEAAIRTLLPIFEYGTIPCFMYRWSVVLPILASIQNSLMVRNLFFSEVLVIYHLLGAIAGWTFRLNECWFDILIYHLHGESNIGTNLQMGKFLQRDPLSKCLWMDSEDWCNLLIGKQGGIICLCGHITISVKRYLDNMRYPYRHENIRIFMRLLICVTLVW